MCGNSIITLFGGAVSSLGKTTFCLQIADHIASCGKDVLIFSLEMARNELIAKSISRLTYTLTLDRKGDIRHAKSTRGILTSSRYDGYSREEKDLISAAIDAYEGCSRHIFITEGIGDVGIDAIRDRVRRHVRITGKAPVVLIDYLQILSPADPRATDKQNTDKAVLPYRSEKTSDGFVWACQRYGRFLGQCAVRSLSVG